MILANYALSFAPVSRLFQVEKPMISIPLPSIWIAKARNKQLQLLYLYTFE